MPPGRDVCPVRGPPPGVGGSARGVNGRDRRANVMYHPAPCTGMERKDAIFDGIESDLRDLDAAREETIRVSRDVVRLTKAAIRAVHDGGDAAPELAAVDEAVGRLNAAADRHTALRHHGIVESALAEAAETRIFHAAVKGAPMPEPAAIGVSPSAYLLGAADAVGELRRWLMNALLGDDIDEVRRVFAIMEELHDRIDRFSLPDGVVPVRRKQDVVRGLMDRTRALVVDAAERRRGAK